MENFSRRVLLAGGAGTVGAIGLAGVASAQAPSPAAVIDLAASYKVVVNDESAAQANADAINKAIREHPVDTNLVLPAGTVFVRRVLGNGPHRFAAIQINGTDKQRLTLSGQGSGVTRLVLTGSMNFGLCQIIQVADGPRRVTLRDFAIEHGPNATDPAPDLQNHHIELFAQTNDVVGTEIRDIFFGACVGDAIRLGGSDPDSTPAVLRETTIRGITMHLDKQENTPTRCRSGISFQKGIQDLLLTDFHIEGAKNSPLDCEPTTANLMDNITITNGTIDNSNGDTFVAASFNGFQSATQATTHLTHSRMVNVRIRGGQVHVLSTRGCTLDNVVIEAGAESKDRTDAINSPMLLVFRANEDLALRNVTIVRDTGCPPGPLVTIQHQGTSPRRVAIDGGTWTTRVDTGNGDGRDQKSFVNMEDASGLRMRGTRIRVENTPVDSRHGVRLVTGLGNVTDVHFDGVTIEAPGKLANGFIFGGTQHELTNIAVTGCAITGAADVGIMFVPSSPSVVDRFPVVQANDFARCLTLFKTDKNANGVVFPIIAGNRGSQCTMIGPVAPEGVVAAIQGSQYIRQNGNSPELWWKATGTGPTGWTKLA